MRQSVAGDEDVEDTEVRNCRALRERRIKGDFLMLSLRPGRESLGGGRK